MAEGAASGALLAGRPGWAAAREPAGGGVDGRGEEQVRWGERDARGGEHTQHMQRYTAQRLAPIATIASLCLNTRVSQLAVRATEDESGRCGLRSPVELDASAWDWARSDRDARRGGGTIEASPAAAAMAEAGRSSVSEALRPSLAFASIADACCATSQSLRGVLRSRIASRRARASASRRRAESARALTSAARTLSGRSSVARSHSFRHRCSSCRVSRHDARLQCSVERSSASVVACRAPEGRRHDSAPGDARPDPPQR